MHHFHFGWDFTPKINTQLCVHIKVSIYAHICIYVYKAYTHIDCWVALAWDNLEHYVPPCVAVELRHCDVSGLGTWDGGWASCGKQQTWHVGRWGSTFSFCASLRNIPCCGLASWHPQLSTKGQFSVGSFCDCKRLEKTQRGSSVGEVSMGTTYSDDGSW